VSSLPKFVASVSIAGFSFLYMEFLWKFCYLEITSGRSQRDLNQTMMEAMAVLQYKWKDNCLLEY
jgi:hypothetical protein